MRPHEDQTRNNMPDTPNKFRRMLNPFTISRNSIMGVATAHRNIETSEHRNSEHQKCSAQDNEPPIMARKWSEWIH